MCSKIDVPTTNYNIILVFNTIPSPSVQEIPSVSLKATKCKLANFANV
jgi:hypothetical protein